MIDVKATIVTALSGAGLDVYYEAFVDSSTPIPCITYLETSNTDYIVGDTLSYSNLVYQVKVWSKSVAELEEYALEIDTIMKSLGFFREFGTQIFIDGLGQYVMRYKALGYETN